jgi:SAM-dependent methyltransferase
MRLEQVVPWGRSLHEYQHMFDLSPVDLQLRILDCAGGPASFNAEMTQLGHSVLSCDPLYQFSAAEIATRVEETYPKILQGLEINYQRFVWQEITSPAHLGEVRMASLAQFLQDFSQGLLVGRYQNLELPTLPFADQEFDLALCSHFLFTYSDQLSLQFHLDSILEMLRVAAEVRIFPLLVNMTGEVSPYLELVLETLQSQGYEATLQKVPYEFQRGGNQMLRIKESPSPEFGRGI